MIHKLINERKIIQSVKGDTIIPEVTSVEIHNVRAEKNATCISDYFLLKYKVLLTPVTSLYANKTITTRRTKDTTKEE